MEIITYFWDHFLYIPLFNLLIFLYFNFANFNMGVAVIELTLVLRIILIPFTFLVERGKVAGPKMHEEARQIDKDFGSDPVRRKVAIRKLLKKYHIHPWAKAVVIGAQALVFVLLYQVFVDAIGGYKYQLLYPGMPRPDFVITEFWGIDVGTRSLILAAICAIYLFIEYLLANRHRQDDMTRNEQMYGIMFPAMTFLILAFLPGAKSLFVLTSLVFSTIIHTITSLIKLNVKKIEEAKKKEEERLADPGQEDIIT